MEMHAGGLEKSGISCAGEGEGQAGKVLESKEEQQGLLCDGRHRVSTTKVRSQPAGEEQHFPTSWWAGGTTTLTGPTCGEQG